MSKHNEKIKNQRIEIVKDTPNDTTTDSPSIMMKKRDFAAIIQNKNQLCDEAKKEALNYLVDASGKSQLCDIYKKKIDEDEKRIQRLEKELKLYKNKTISVDVQEILKKSEMSYEQMCTESQKIAQEIYDKKYAPQIKALSEKYGIKL